MNPPSPQRRPGRLARSPSPASVFDPLLQQERTSLAWERTAIATMVAGLLLARQAAELHLALAAIGIAQVVGGSVLLVWAGRHYHELHDHLRSGHNPVHPTGARLVGVSTTLFTGAALLVSLWATLT